MSTQPRTQLTPEQYLEIERKAECKGEYLAGQMFAKAGASRAHNLLQSNLIAGLHPRLLTSDCELYASDMRVRVTKTGLYSTLESLSEYLVIAQDRLHARVYRRHGGDWILSRADRLTDTLELRSIGCKVAMADLYHRVELPPAQSSGELKPLADT